MKIQNRNQFPQLLTSMGLTGNAVEVGTAEGYWSHHMLDHWSGRMTQVDPYRILDVPGFTGHGESDNAGLERRYQRMLKAAEKYKGRCVVMRKTSEEAAQEFYDGSLDFCYLDANHSPAAIRQDLQLWHPKVKPGGILAGHDYLEGIHNGQEYGVRQAVTEFAAERGLTVNVTGEKDWPSWFVIVP